MSLKPGSSVEGFGSPTCTATRLSITNRCRTYASRAALSSAAFLGAGACAHTKAAKPAKHSNFLCIFSHCTEPYTLHYRPDPPRHEFAMPQPLRARSPSGSHIEQQIEDLATHLLHRRLAISDAPGVDVHVVHHAAVGI